MGEPVPVFILSLMLQKRIWWSDKIADVQFVIQKTVVYIHVSALIFQFSISILGIKGKGHGKMSLSLLCRHLDFWCSGNKSLSLISAPSISLSLSLPAPLQLCISESQCTLNSYVLVSYGYDLRWHAGVPFPFSALPAPYRYSHNVRAIHKTCMQSHSDAVQTSALTHALHIIIVI